MISQASSSTIYGSLWLLLQLIDIVTGLLSLSMLLAFQKAKDFFPVTNSPMGENDFSLFTFSQRTEATTSTKVCLKSVHKM